MSIRAVSDLVEIPHEILHQNANVIIFVHFIFVDGLLFLSSQEITLIMVMDNDSLE